MKRRIVFVNPCSDVSGAEVSLLLLLKGLDQQRYERVLVAPEEGVFTRKARMLGVEVCILPMHAMMIERDVIASLGDALKSFKEIGDIHRLLLELKPDLLHVNSYRIGVPFSLAARRLGIPSIWHFRDIPQSPLKRRLLTWLIHLPTRVVAISNAVARSITSQDYPQLVVIHNGVDLELYDRVTPTTLRDEFNIDKDAGVFCSIGQLTPWKGQDLLIRAFADITRDSDLPLRLLIVGDEINPVWSVRYDNHHYPDQLKQLVHDFDLQERVLFTGFRDDVPQLLMDIDCLVHTPRAPEPFGRVLVEAMAAGKPVIAPASGGIPEIVENGMTGLLFEPGNLESLTNALAYSIKNKSLMQEMGCRGAQRAQERFSAQQHVDKISHLYAQLL